MQSSLMAMKDDILCELASRDLWWFCKLKAPDFYKNDCDYLKEICDAIQEFENDDNELLVIQEPPRHGKSRTKDNASEWLLGRNNEYKIISASYNEKLSRRSSKAVRDSIRERKSSKSKIVFSDIFPNTKIAFGASQVDLWRLEGNDEDNYLATAPGATVTGFGADFILIDDIVKNSYEANHAGHLEEHYVWFTDTMYSRLEGKRKVIIIMTRWSTKDLAGRVIELYKSQGRKYRVLSKKAYDGKRMLNDRVLSKAQYDLLIQTIGEDIVKANYDQEPIDLKGRLYQGFRTYKEAPRFVAIKAVCDTADEGDDYLCNIIFGETYDRQAYVLDVYYTKDNMDKTEVELPERLTNFNVSKFKPESNFGGTAYAKLIMRRLKEIGNGYTLARPFTQTKNKKARILSNCTNVTRNVFFPEDWQYLWPEFYKAVTEYQREGKNEHDDAPDTLTMIVEEIRPIY